MEKIKEIIVRNGSSKENLIQIMLEIKEHSKQNYLPKECVAQVSEALDVPMSKVYEVITFYSMFSTKPRGKHLIEVCKSGPCHISGAENIIQLLKKELDIKIGETTADGSFTLEKTNCFGACDIAPAMKIGEKVYGNLNSEKIKEILNTYREGL